MKVYQLADAEDKGRYGRLYEKCRSLEGVEYVGSLPQPELARQLRGVSVLAYPNTFAETSCIAVMEAMAAGCSVVTSELGALPETTAGFARLVSMDGGMAAYLDRFVDALVQVLGHLSGLDAGLREQKLANQVEYVNSKCIWTIRAAEMIECLQAVMNAVVLQ